MVLGLIKCRICVRGFKDQEKNYVDRFSGTSSRWAKRTVLAIAVQSGWKVASTDISMAFLRGLSFDEIQAIRGGPKREVSMRLPAGKRGEPSDSVLLRTFEGYESFNDALEVLEMLQGGFGPVDAPALFTTRADRVLRAADILPTAVDPKVYIRHQAGKLVLHVGAHLDDFEATGPDAQLEYVLKTLPKSFGEDMKMEMKKTFVRTGINHYASKEL